MNSDAKKTVLRMIPYGIYVLTADDGKGGVAAATVNFVTQSSFAPPLVVVGVKADSAPYQVVKAAGKFALNMLGKDQKGLAFTFFQPGRCRRGQAQRPALSRRQRHRRADPRPRRPARSSARSRPSSTEGDHHIVIGEVVEAHPDEAARRPSRRRHP